MSGGGAMTCVQSLFCVSTKRVYMICVALVQNALVHDVCTVAARIVAAFSSSAWRERTACSTIQGRLYEQLPNHRHRNLKAFEEHIQKHIYYLFVTESYLYYFSGSGVRVVWKLFIILTACGNAFR